jgi:hypothetical protein
MVLDDVMHRTWPGVNRGLLSFWNLHDTTFKHLAPLLMGAKKLWLTSRAWHSNYSSALKHTAKYALNKSKRPVLMRLPQFMKLLSLYDKNNSRATPGYVPIATPFVDFSNARHVSVWISLKLNV